MAVLTDVSGREAVRAFQRAGWMVLRQKGSHVIMGKSGERTRIVIPMHDALKRGLLLARIKDAGLTPEEFLKLL
ncbi:MAG: type II toxin-antitoxin system HicA family toxin [Thermoplasmata archaeon]